MMVKLDDGREFWVTSAPDGHYVIRIDRDPERILGVFRVHSGEAEIDALRTDEDVPLQWKDVRTVLDEKELLILRIGNQAIAEGLLDA